MPQIHFIIVDKIAPNSGKIIFKFSYIGKKWPIKLKPTIFLEYLKYFFALICRGR